MTPSTPQTENPTLEPRPFPRGPRDPRDPQASWGSQMFPAPEEWGSPDLLPAAPPRHSRVPSRLVPVSPGHSNSQVLNPRSPPVQVPQDCFPIPEPLSP
jgi:hypothetical protein